MSKVLLISGHGKNYNGTYDPGAYSIFGQEADYTRELVSMVYQSLGKASDIEVYDQEKNCYSYSKAGQVPNYGAYSLVLEVHFNAKVKKDESGDGKFTGIGAYVHPDNAGGKKVAENIITAVSALGFGKWQIADSTGLLNLNRAQKAGTKYLLLETAFIDDGDDMAWYNANKARVAQAIAQVINKEIEGTTPAVVPTPPENSQKPGDSPVGEDKGYVPGMYKVNVKDLNIRSGPGTGYKNVGSIIDQGTYTIVTMSGSWGRLNSGAGWINCSTKYCTRAGDANADGTGAEPEDHTKAFEVLVKINDLNIRKGPGTSYGTNGICPPGMYNILETKAAGGYTWGRLKSGAGWIALEHTEKF